MFFFKKVTFKTVYIYIYIYIYIYKSVLRCVIQNPSEILIEKNKK